MLKEKSTWNQACEAVRESNLALSKGKSKVCCILSSLSQLTSKQLHKPTTWSVSCTGALRIYMQHMRMKLDTYCPRGMNSSCLQGR